MLIVDDDLILLEIAATCLIEDGWRVDTAGDGAEALAHLQTRAYDVIVTDLDMPNVNGYELTASVRRDAAHAQTPIVAVTGSEAVDRVERAYEAGATSFVTKPVDWKMFPRHVRFVHRASLNEQALRAARAEAEAASRAKDALFAIVRHELQTPMNHVVGFSQLCVDEIHGPLGDEQYREYVGHVLSSGLALSRKLDRMLLCARVYAQTAAAQESVFGLDEILEAAALSVGALAREKGVVVSVDEPDVDIYVRADRDLMQRSAEEIVNNAVRFSPDGGEVRLSVETDAEGGVAFIVRDAGPGLSPRDVDDLLNPFTQADMRMERAAEGMGLGLAIARRAMELHGGALRVSPGETSGAVVALALPKVRLLIEDVSDAA
ncbi:MAG: response regulator [Caulobacterales bacterium]|nr:response regulator [Caulobacterales bacterium]